MAAMLFDAKGVRDLGEKTAADGSGLPTAIHPLRLDAQKLDIAAIKARYEAERLKRHRTDGTAQFRQPRGEQERVSPRLRQDIYTPHPKPREPITADTKVVIVGAGFAGLATAVNLKQNRGVEDFYIVDKAGGFGGTWYWNQYPGVACDVEAYIYLPFLEETDYLPEDRFAYGPEIRRHMQRVVAKWELDKHACLSTEITSIEWDASQRRWHVRTNRGDHFTTQFVVTATGTFYEPKLPAYRGMDDFARPHFHSSRWDYSVTGGSPDNWELTKLRDKTVGIIGTGCSAVQIVPHLARWAKHVYVFQRTPSSITFRDNFKTADDPEVRAGTLTAAKGWQRARMEEFANILQGTVLDRDSPTLDGLEALTARALLKEAAAAGAAVSFDEIPELLELSDLRLMHRIRSAIETIVHDKDTAEKLKPWYPFMCKRAAFHNDYLASFNCPNVTLVDTDAQGVEHVTQTAVVANGGKEYEVDVLVYSTGFDYETNEDYYRRTGIQLVGAKGKTLDETWKQHNGPLTLFGIHYIDFPNLFNIGPSQAGVTANWTHVTYVAAEHIANVIGDMLDQSVEAIVPSYDAAEQWGQQIDEGSEARLKYNQACPPGYYNKQGRAEDIAARAAFYPKGIMEWQRVMKEWREKGSFDGMERL